MASQLPISCWARRKFFFSSTIFSSSSSPSFLFTSPSLFPCPVVMVTVHVRLRMVALSSSIFRKTKQSVLSVTQQHCCQIGTMNFTPIVISYKVHHTTDTADIDGTANEPMIESRYCGGRAHTHCIESARPSMRRSRRPASLLCVCVISPRHLPSLSPGEESKERERLSCYTLSFQPTHTHELPLLLSLKKLCVCGITPSWTLCESISTNESKE